MHASGAATAIPRGTRLPKGAQWFAHDKRGGRAATRRLRQMLTRGVMICAGCEQERPLGMIRLYRTDAAGALLVTDDTELGISGSDRAICIDCLPPEEAATAEETETPDDAR